MYVFRRSREGDEVSTSTLGGVFGRDGAEPARADGTARTSVASPIVHGAVKNARGKIVKRCPRLRGPLAVSRFACTPPEATDDTLITKKQSRLHSAIAFLKQDEGELF